MVALQKMDIPEGVGKTKKGRKGKAAAPELVTDPLAVAKAANLVYISDDMPGITRKRSGKKFSYTDADGNPLRDKAERKRIDTLAIPPAYTDVWISPDPDGHIQATGRDERGRKQYRYHERWAEQREQNKFSRMMLFGAVLPKIRAQLAHDLALRGLPREKVIATVILLMDKTFIRVGNAEYARDNDSYGLTTLRDDHVDVSGTSIAFKFRGKSGKDHEIDLRDKRLAKVVKQCQELPGQHLFQYVGDDDSPHAITSADINTYLQEVGGDHFTAKDFRTWGGTTLAVLACASLGDPEGITKGETKRRLSSMIKSVSQTLGNTQAVCKKYYVHPSVGEAYLGGNLLALMAEEVARGETTNPYDLTAPERVVVRLLDGKKA